MRRPRPRPPGSPPPPPYRSAQARPRGASRGSTALRGGSPDSPPPRRASPWAPSTHATSPLPWGIQPPSSLPLQLRCPAGINGSQVVSWCQALPEVTWGHYRARLLTRPPRAHPRLCPHHRLLGRKAPRPPGHRGCPHGPRGADLPPQSKASTPCPSPRAPSNLPAPTDPPALAVRQGHPRAHPHSIHPCSGLWGSPMGLGCMGECAATIC